MVAIRPLRKSRVVKKRTKKFIRHQSDRYIKLKVKMELLVCNYVHMPNDILYYLALCCKIYLAGIDIGIE